MKRFGTADFVLRYASTFSKVLIIKFPKARHLRYLLNFQRLPIMSDLAQCSVRGTNPACRAS